jgi:WD40 repeat protein
MIGKSALRTLRIFISSPGDVHEERDRARQVIEGLRRRYARKFVLKPVLWEDLPLQLTATFQEGVEVVLSQDHGIDIAVFILWSRLGSALGPSIKTSDGRQYRSGTEREFDLMLQARAEGDGDRPAILAYTRSDEKCFDERLRGRSTTEKEGLITQKKLVEAFIAENFVDQSTGHNTRAYHTFDRPVKFSQRLRAHLVELLDRFAGESTETIWDIAVQGPPYLGLKAFQPEHADIFFGREEESLEVRFALSEQAKRGCAFLLLTGASGSGKSSLARSGVLPDIVQHELDEQVVAWKSVALTPADLTRDPVVGLLQRLATPAVWSGIKNDEASLEKLARAFRKNPQLAFELGLQPAIDRLTTRHGGGVRLLLVIDQMEEIFSSHVMTAVDRTAFLQMIEIFARSGVVWVLATARSDFFHQIQSEPALARLLELRGPMPISSPGPDALQRLIEEPARIAGLRFEERGGISLSSRILRDAVNHAESLPLLEFVLRELYESSRSTSGVLTWSVYEQLGGIEGAVGKRAEETFRGLPADSQAALAEILPLLVTIETAGEQSAVRRYALLAELQAMPQRRTLADGLIAGRFLTTDRQGGNRVASFTHEALLRRWDRISGWINANREHLRIRSRILGAVASWEKHHRSGDLLLSSGKPLDEANELLASNMPLDKEVREFIEQSRLRALRNRRLRRLAVGSLAVLTILSIIAGGMAWNARGEAQLSQQLAERRALELTQQLYDNSIAIAEREISQNQDIGKACALLEGDTCPDSLRGWEWHYLMRLRDGQRAPLKGHQNGLWGAEFSPDGKLVATCSIDGTVRIFDAISGETLRIIDADRIANASNLMKERGYIDTIPIMCLAFSPDGRRLATGSFSPQVSFDGKPNRFSPGLVRLWDVATGKLDSEFSDQKGVCLSLAFSPDGKQIASSSIDSEHSFVVWDVATKRVIKRMLGHTSHVLRLHYSRDGRVLASGDADGYFKLWNTADLSERMTVRAHSGPLIGISFAPKGSNRFATAGQDGFVRIFNSDDGRRELEMVGHAGAALDVCYSPDGRRIATSGIDKTIRIWDTTTGRQKLTLRGHRDLVWSVAFSTDDDGARLLSASFDYSARIWDARPRKAAPASGEFAVSGHTERVNSIAANERSDQIVSGGWDQSVRLWDARTGKPGAVLTGHTGPIWTVALSPDGTKIASASWDHTVKIWDRKAGKLLFTFKQHTAPVHTVAFSPDGRTLASGGFDGLMRIWDSTTGKLIADGDGFVFPVYAIAFSPDGRFIASGGADRKITVWRTADAERVLALPEDPDKAAHTASIYSLSFNSDGTRLASASWDHTVRVWNTGAKSDAAEDRELRVIEGHKDRVNSVVFSRQGNLFATASEDKTVRLWDAETGVEVASPRIHRGIVWSVAFSPDGRGLFSASWEEPFWIHAWNISKRNPLEEESR